MVNKIKNQPVRHISSNEPIVFFTQILTVSALIFMAAYLLFVFSWTSQQKIVRQQPIQTEPGVVNTQAIQRGVDESQFLEKPDGTIDQAKLKDLFPEVK